VDDSEVIREFLIESTENLGRLDQEIVQLEQSPKDAQLLASVFRTMHTIKGTGGMLGFGAVEKLAHLAENLLSQVRNGERDLTAPLVSLVLRAVDAVKAELLAIEAGGKESGVSHAALEDELRRACENKPAASAQGEAAGSEAPPAAGEDGGGAQKNLSEDSTIRVDVGLLDRLMNLVGELVLARNQILQFDAGCEDSSFNASAQRVDLITTELQEGVMKTRMQPIGNIWNKFPRVVRDMAMASGKQVRIEMEGKDTELDRTIIEAIKDPLTHLVRNAVDHGLESPAARKATGKDPEGRLLLRAFHEGGQVNIEITDDGAGLDYERIRAKAIEKNLVSREQAARLSEREIANLIFLPGFSTAERVTNVSGRGVGMDVVKTNIEKIGGAVDVHSKPGQGSTVRMKIPLTLAIIPALIVTSGGDRYAIPQVSLLELVRLEGEQLRGGIELVNGAPVHRLRGQLLPLLYLARELGTDDLPARAAENGLQPGGVNIVVLRADDRQFGLVVDEVNETEEIVVKPLSQPLKNINTFAGATIMGDGRIALILDVVGLAQRADVVGEGQGRALAEERKPAENKQAATRRQVLLCQYGEGGQVAIDLSAVGRLEQFPVHRIEIADDREAVQYRGQIMPLLRVSDLLQGKHRPAPREQALVHVVVYADRGRNVGLVVDRILDIVDEAFRVERQTGRRGVLGSAVIQKRITDIVDIPQLLGAAEPGAQVHA
jgi:two-component system chemotaxis sensor kinase CheA